MSDVDHEVIIGGSGFAGLCMAFRLRQAGIDDVLILEQADALGGTWRDNTYPGCACDVPAPLYSFSFRPNPDWSRLYASWEEIRDYMERCTDEFGLRDALRFGAQVTAAAWEDDTQRWRVEINGAETLTARFLVSALGGLTKPAYPDIPGLDDFRGPAIHSARWDHSVDLARKRLAVIGTGASSIQFTPQVAPAAAHVDVYQRTPPWVLPRLDRAFAPWERRLFARLPVTQMGWRALIWSLQEGLAIGNTLDPRLNAGLESVARGFIRHQVPDPDLRALVTPSYRIGCKRILVANDWYPALMRPNVDLITSGIASITPDGVVDLDGVERPADALLLGTGFQVFDILTGLSIRGRDGLDLADAWSGGIAAHLGTTVAGFPNLFLLTGPNTGTGHTSQLYMIECQVHYILAALRALRAEGAAVLEVSESAQRAYNEWLQTTMQRTVWIRGGCKSWYLDDHGVNRTLWPSFSFRYRAATRRFDRERYALTAPRRAPEPLAV